MNSAVLITLIICLTLVISQVINLANNMLNPKPNIEANPKYPRPSKPGLNYHDNNKSKNITAKEIHDCFMREISDEFKTRLNTEKR